MNSFSNVAGYNAFLYNINEQIEKGYKKTIPVTIASKKIQIPKSKLMKDINDLYKENYKPLKQEIKEDYKSWKNLPGS
jgi:hypothetical protein